MHENTSISNEHLIEKFIDETPNKHKQKLEFSKKIFYIVTSVTIAVVIFSLFAIWETKNLDPLNVLIPSVFTEFAAATGFYYVKAAIENKVKIMKQLVLDIADEYGIENAIEIARTCFENN